RRGRGRGRSGRGGGAAAPELVRPAARQGPQGTLMSRALPLPAIVLPIVAGLAGCLIPDATTNPALPPPPIPPGPPEATQVAVVKPVAKAPPIETIVAGRSVTCVLAGDTTVRCW